MIYVCPEKDRAVQRPCVPCICGMDKLAVFRNADADTGCDDDKLPGTADDWRKPLQQP